MQFHILPFQLAVLFLAHAVSASTEPADAPPPQFVPQPVQVQLLPGSFTLSADTTIDCARDLAPVGELAAAQLGIRSARTGSGMVNAIHLAAEPDLPAEAYRLDITADRITLIGGSATGLYHGLQTLRQAIPQKTLPANIHCLSITDQPRFAWRGLMLDCSRTFQSLDYLRKTIDRIAFYKLNVLHLHLTDDQGWRVEIRKHPELTHQGARFSPKFNEPQSHQGSYTQAELRELVAYASLRGVTIVPEIEMPGHSLALLVCHPELSCRGKIPDIIFPFAKGPDITSDILCAGNDDTFRLLQEVIDEVVEIFPSQFIHVGGDEAPKERWKTCPKCQARIKTEGLKNEHELQSYFLRRIEKHINAKGRRLVGWSEILQGGLAPNAAVMDWIGGAREATQSGHDAVMSPTSHCYFDYSYEAISAERAYSFDPVAGLSPSLSGHILGLQANFWSHIDREPALVDRQLFPRLLSIAERAWSPATNSDWPAFHKRLNAQLPRLRQMGIHYHTMQPVGKWTPREVTEQYAQRSWDITSQLTGIGKYVTTFRYAHGAHRLGIQRVELLANGRPVSTDTHRGVTGTASEANTYTLELNALHPGTKYEIRAAIRSEGGTDSNGTVYLEAMPAQSNSQ